MTTDYAYCYLLLLAVAGCCPLFLAVAVWYWLLRRCPLYYNSNYCSSPRQVNGKRHVRRNWIRRTTQSRCLNRVYADLKSVKRFKCYRVTPNEPPILHSQGNAYMALKRASILGFKERVRLDHALMYSICNANVVLYYTVMHRATSENRCCIASYKDSSGLQLGKLSRAAEDARKNAVLRT